MLAGCGGGGGGGGGSADVNSQSLIGNVFNGATGDPVVGASVQLAGRSTTTDAAGNYQFEDLAADFTGGEVTVTAGGFDEETAAVTLSGSALQVPPVGLTPTPQATAVSPTAGAVVSSSVPEAPELPQASLNIPAGALPGSSNADVSVTPTVDVALDALVESLSVQSLSVGDTAQRGPEIRLNIRPHGLVLNTPVQVTLPLPFALTPGGTVPIIQRKNGVWREVGTAVVNETGAAAVGEIREFLPTGAECWHGFTKSTSNDPDMPLDEVSLASIGNDIRNLPDRSYVVNRMVQDGRVAKITARFQLGFLTPELPTSPVDEESLVLGRRAHRDRIRDRFFKGPWSVSGGPVTFGLRTHQVVVRRFVDGQAVSEAGSFVLTHGRPSWPRPSNHNQGGVQ
jgi:hypothetical protein